MSRKGGVEVLQGHPIKGRRGLQLEPFKTSNVVDKNENTCSASQAFSSNKKDGEDTLLMF